MIHSKQAAFNLARVAFWLALTPIAYFLGWLNLVTFVSLISIWSLVETAWAAYEASNDKALMDKLEHIIEILEDRV